MKREVMIIRIDPAKRTIARIPMRSSRSAAVGTREAKRIIRADRVGMREMLALKPHALMVAGRLDVTEAMPGWRFRGNEETAGISFLFGRGEGQDAGMVDVPVDVAWVQKRIVWMTCEYQDDAESVPE